MLSKKLRRLLRNMSLCLFSIVVLSLLVCAPCLNAQTWTPLPPYNTLWPLWSPALSPPDPVTGLATPIVDSLYPTTVLPVQPGLTWNPSFSYPYLLYNTPIGMAYYDPLYGINLWPPNYMIDTVTGLPIPVGLPLGFSLLLPTDPLWIEDVVPIANLAYIAEYPNYANLASTIALPPNLTGLTPWLASLITPTPTFSSLLTPAAILGY
ncbi:MAG: hypothetical protein ACMUJM_09950 [bacterium]